MPKGEVAISKRLVFIVIFIFVVAILYFLGRYIFVSGKEIIAAHIKFTPVYLAISIVFLLAGSFLGTYAWYRVIIELGEEITYWQALKAIAISQFGKYLPGKVWTVGGRVVLAKRYGISEMVSTTGIFIETVVVLLSAIIIFILSSGFYRTEFLPSKIYLVFLLIPLSLLLLHPKILKFIINVLARLFKRNIATIDFKFKKLAMVYFLYFLSWAVHSCGFFFITRAIYPISLNNFLGIIGSYSISWALSFIFFLIPGGFGIREGLLTFFLKFFMPLPFATLMAFVGRLWTTFGEICYFLISLIKKQ